MKRFLTAFTVVSAVIIAGLDSIAIEKFVSFEPVDSGFAIVRAGRPLDICVDQSDDPAVQIAARTLSGDFGRVCGDSARVVDRPSGECIIAGSIESSLIKPMLESGKIQAAELEGKREKYILSVIDNPLEGVDKAVVIAGSDRRGAVYGIYELSRQMGVSPWYWWMDVHVEHREHVAVMDGVFTDGEPKVE
ncbi:MAG: glycosyhydrolase, partial [Muribaculaceae bacterium]|nr:glycosyhydrolase [Muribaculaceae bacterium]